MKKHLLNIQFFAEDDNPADKKEEEVTLVKLTKQLKEQNDQLKKSLEEAKKEKDEMVKELFDGDFSVEKKEEKPNYKTAAELREKFNKDLVDTSKSSLDLIKDMNEISDACKREGLPSPYLPPKKSKAAIREGYSESDLKVAEVCDEFYKQVEKDCTPDENGNVKYPDADTAIMLNIN